MAEQARGAYRNNLVDRQNLTLSQRCGGCVFWKPLLVEGELVDPEPDDIGACTWSPDGGMPISWRCCRRKVIGVTYNENASKCGQYRHKRPSET